MFDPVHRIPDNFFGTFLVSTCQITFGWINLAAKKCSLPKKISRSGVPVHAKFQES